MRFFRCRVCDEACFGTEAPSRCPFCGAAHRHLLPARALASRSGTVQPTEIERAELEAAMIEAAAAARYFMAVSRSAEQLDDGDLASAYARRAAIERAHAALFARLADLPAPDEPAAPAAEAPATLASAIAEGVELARRAADRYEAAAARATDERVREVFLALSQAQTDLIALDAELMELVSEHER